MKRPAGFTLIEVLVAMAIFAIIAILAYSGLDSVVNSKNRTEASMQRLQQLQMAMLTLTSDLQQLSDRNGHDALGGRLINLTTQNSDYIVSFTRSGWRNPTMQLRSTLQRVAYYQDEDKLMRVYWPQVDRAIDEQTIEQPLISNIDSLELRFMSKNRQWRDDWPSASATASSGAGTFELPLAVEITLKMSDWGEIRRLVRVAR